MPSSSEVRNTRLTSDALSAAIVAYTISGRPKIGTVLRPRNFWPSARPQMIAAIMSGHGLDPVRTEPMLHQRNLPFVVDVETAPLLERVDLLAHPLLRQQAGV